ncbi:aminopeptidase [Brachybacterium endophyticum]|uniref:Aminopeptidase n=1 Tax=Brachybacterium endophyticum TaxID=2182385 RepID=A0A2U2RNL2_9MICO|nr:alpha/beta fold hydrolase [Brachybacterium endophyticum]PWH07462.1 aminopeptidase [Brachybacterium endophyticum]
MPSSPRLTTWNLPGLQLTDVRVDAPLDHENPSGPELEIFARVATAPGGEDRPYLVYLQGGPGSEAPRPSVTPANPPWLPRALRDYQVVMLDQRGTGLSTPVGLDTPLPTGAIPTVAPPGTPPEATTTLRQATPAQQADYLSHFRADAIVRDAELVREALGAETWTLLGQSFGGFTTLRYLSDRAASLTGAMFTGGIPQLGPDLDQVYATTWDGMIARSEAHYARFPGDRERMRRLAELAGAGELVLGDGEIVGVERLRRLGHLLGASGGSAKLHYLLENEPTSPVLRHDLAGALPFAGRNPIYAVLHESCWADGVAMRWAAERTMPDRVRADPTLLAGEHMHREAITEDPELAPWAEAAELLAERTWPALYDPEALRAADVPVAAAVYYGDAYVPREFSLATADLLPDATCWVTSEYQHNGLRASGEGVLDHLIGLIQGTREA